jgi:hypothetical protein
MCNRFIRSYERFTTRGCYGGLFKLWTVPNVDRLLPGEADRTTKSLILVQKGGGEEIEELSQGPYSARTNFRLLEEAVH